MDDYLSKPVKRRPPDDDSVFVQAALSSRSGMERSGSSSRPVLCEFSVSVHDFASL